MSDKQNNPAVPNQQANVSAPKTMPELPNVRIRERRDVHSMLNVDPESADPERHYRFVRRDSLAMTRAQLKGYKVERQGEGGPKLLGFQPEGTEDGSINVGDTILMSCDRAEYEARRADIDRRNEEKLEQADEEPKQKIREAGNVRGQVAFRVITDKE